MVCADSVGVPAVLRFDGYPRSMSLPSQREQRRILLLVLLIGSAVLLPQWIRTLGVFGQPAVTDDQRQLSDNSGNTKDAVATSENGAGLLDRVQNFLAQLDKIDFSPVEDNTPFRNEEKTAWFSTLAFLSHLSRDDLQSLRAPWVTFAQLYRNTPQYRGKVVAIRGEFMGVTHLPAPPNDQNIQGYYQAWLCPDREQDPVVVYCLQLPSGFPEGMRIREPVEVVGVCFKRWVYQAQDGLRMAPVILTKEPFWIRPPVASDTSTDSSPNLVLAIIVSAIVTLAFVFYVFRRREERRPRLPEAS